MAETQKHYDTGSLLVIFVTLALFVTALFVKGLTHDLLLEAGVFLVSVKLIIISHKNAVASNKLRSELSEIRLLLQRLESPKATGADIRSTSGAPSEPLGQSD